MRHGVVVVRRTDDLGRRDVVERSTGRLLGWIVPSDRSPAWLAAHRVFSAYAVKPDGNGRPVGTFPTLRAAADEVWIERDRRSQRRRNDR